MTGSVDQPEEVGPQGAETATLSAAVERTKREAVESVLGLLDGNVARAAVALGVTRTSLYRIMRRYGIAAPRRPRVLSPEQQPSQPASS